MERKRIDMFLMTYHNSFSTQQQAMIRERLEHEPDDLYATISSQSYRNCTLMIILSIVSIDRFMLGDIVLGVLKLLTYGGCGFWWLIDIFTTKKRTHNYNFNLFNEALMIVHIGKQAYYEEELTEYEEVTEEE